MADFSDHFFGSQIGGVDAEFSRLFVERPSFPQQLVDPRDWISRFQERPIQLVSKAFQQYFALGLQADDPPKGAEEGDIPRPKNHPTSRHDDGTLRPVDSLQGCTFFGPKSFFTHFGENSANWHSTNLCDHLVRIKN